MYFGKGELFVDMILNSKKKKRASLQVQSACDEVILNNNCIIQINIIQLLFKITTKGLTIYIHHFFQREVPKMNNLEKKKKKSQKWYSIVNPPSH